MVLVNLLSSTTLDELDNTPPMELLFVGSLVSNVYHAMHDLLNTIHNVPLETFYSLFAAKPSLSIRKLRPGTGQGPAFWITSSGVRESLPVVLTARDNQTCP